jgi:hypothetical protein
MIRILCSVFIDLGFLVAKIMKKIVLARKKGKNKCEK